MSSFIILILGLQRLSFKSITGFYSHELYIKSVYYLNPIKYTQELCINYIKECPGYILSTSNVSSACLSASPPISKMFSKTFPCFLHSILKNNNNLVSLSTHQPFHKSDHRCHPVGSTIFWWDIKNRSNFLWQDTNYPKSAILKATGILIQCSGWNLSFSQYY